MPNQFIGETIADKYRIDSVLRDTAAGRIYLATHLSMDKPVSVKILAPALASDEKAVKEFSNEARIASRVAHPNVLNVTDFGSDVNGTVYAVMEDANGETLKEAVEEKGKFPLTRAVRIAWQVASALSAAHRAGIVHGHLNAENILLTGGAAETVKVLGFGAAEKIYAPGEEPDVENLLYLAPEQNASEKATERSDVYALGVILYEMLAGEVPFRAETANALVMKQAQNPPAPLSTFRPDLPEAVEPVVMKALAVNPDLRFENAAEFANALNNATNNAGGAQTIIVEDEPAKNNLWKTAFVVLAGITLLAAGLIYATSVKQTPIQTQLETDANGQPVQPINPATGMNEQNLSQMMPYSPDASGALAMPSGAPVAPGTAQPVPNGDGLGDGYNAWANGGRPPAGAPPQYVTPGGQVVTIPGDGSSVFMPNENGGGYIMVPVNPNANAQASPTPKNGKAAAPNANANTSAQPSPTPGAQTPTDAAKPTPTPAAPKTDKAPAAKPAPSPKAGAPASSSKPAPNGTNENL